MSDVNWPPKIRSIRKSKLEQELDQSVRLFEAGMPAKGVSMMAPMSAEELRELRDEMIAGIEKQFRPRPILACSRCQASGQIVCSCGTDDDDPDFDCYADGWGTGRAQ